MGRVLRGFGGLVVGGLTGVLVSVLVNNALLEISKNSFFAILFGSALIFMGCLILYRIRELSKANANKSTPSKYFVMAFALLVVLAGMFCFFLDTNWFTFSPLAKVPMYTLLGIALWFALTFTIMDLYNYIGGYISARVKGDRIRPLVSSPQQICSVLFIAVTLGAYYGMMFGVFDVEDKTNKTRGVDAIYTIPVGTVFCAVFGLVNALWLTSSHPEDFFTKNTYDDGI